MVPGDFRLIAKALHLLHAGAFRACQRAPRGPPRLRRPHVHSLCVHFVHLFIHSFHYILLNFINFHYIQCHFIHVPSMSIHLPSRLCIPPRSKLADVVRTLCPPAPEGAERLGGALAVRSLHQEHPCVPHLRLVALLAADHLRDQAAGLRVREADGKAAALRVDNDALQRLRGIGRRKA